MIDTHAHVLPGLDDGSPDMVTSLRMVAEAAASGTTALVCTPHLRMMDPLFVERAQELIGHLRCALEAAGINIRLCLGFEIDVDVVTGATIEDLRGLVIEGSADALLIEVPHYGWPAFIRETLFRLRTAGFLPVLAHPERNDRIQRSPRLLTECLDGGAIAQGTAVSLDGGFGRAAREALYRHLYAGEISLMASDAHAHRTTSWTLAPLAENLRRRISEDDLNMLVTINPSLLLSGGRPTSVTPSGGRSLRRGRLGWLTSR